MRIFVTGGLGVNGHWTVRELLSRGHELVVLDTREPSADDLALAGEVQFHVGDVCDLERVEGLLRGSGCEVAAHLAALIPAEADPYLGYRVNGLGTVTVFEAARRAGLRRVVFTSSKSVYGDITGDYSLPRFAPLPEEALRGIRPRVEVYGASKQFSEEVGRHYARAFGIEFFALRFATIYGPGKQVRHTSNGVGILSAIVEGAVAGEGTSVPAGADARDDLLYVKDVARSVALACEAPASDHWAFNVGSGRVVALAEFAEVVRREVAEVPIELGPGWDYTGLGQTYPLLDISRARAKLGYGPAYDLTEGIRDYAEHLRAPQITGKPANDERS